MQTSPSLTRSSYRFDSIDLLRGLVMVIMALDHTRDFFHIRAAEDPTDLSITTPALFFTRWVTHFCAPTFVFLSGLSIYLQSRRKTKKELSFFLLTRGLWLILIEVFVINLAYSFDIHWYITGIQVIWAIGISMVILALLIWLPFPVIVALGFLIVLGHNSLDFYEAKVKDHGWLYDLVHIQTFLPLWGKHQLFIIYPFLSWTGLMIIGYGFGKLFMSREGTARRKMLIWLGLGIIAFFIILRATNLYGDNRPWSVQKNMLFTIFSFVNTQKYPPSLLYMCMTIGPAILLLAFFDSLKNRLTEVFTVFGRVPFFYYVLHFYLIHLVCMIFFLARGHSFAEGLVFDPAVQTTFVKPGEGYSLGVVYLVWLGIVISLYPLCKWYSQYKQTHKHWWLSYL